jgi:hypothetical protein
MKPFHTRLQPHHRKKMTRAAFKKANGTMSLLPMREIGIALIIVGVLGIAPILTFIVLARDDNGAVLEDCEPSTLLFTAFGTIGIITGIFLIVRSTARHKRKRCWSSRM